MTAALAIDRTKLSYFECTWTGIVSLADTLLDDDDLPDLDLMAGTIMFTTTLTRPLLFVGQPSYSMFITPRVVNLSDGVFRTKLESSDSLSSNRDWLWIAKFDVYYAGVRLDIPQAVLNAPAQASIDLTDFIGRGRSEVFYAQDRASGTYYLQNGKETYDANGDIIPNNLLIEDPVGSRDYKIKGTA